LQKSLFFLGKTLNRTQLRTSDFYSFDAYDYGPFTSAIYFDAEALQGDGLVAISRDPLWSFKRYTVTDRGKEAAHSLIEKLDARVVEYAKELLSWVTSLSFNDLVREIYKRYPDMKARSVFKD
jgi:uncharacterized protein YwgA